MRAALESRGFSAPVKKTLLYEASFTSLDYAFLMAMLFVTVFLAWVYVYIGFSPLAHLPWIWSGR